MTDPEYDFFVTESSINKERFSGEVLNENQFDQIQEENLFPTNDDYVETAFEEQYENEQFAQDGDEHNMYPNEDGFFTNEYTDY